MAHQYHYNYLLIVDESLKKYEMVMKEKKMNLMMMKQKMIEKMVQVYTVHLFDANMVKYNDDMNVEVDLYYLEKL